jgi:hypothetical protein
LVSTPTPTPHTPRRQFFRNEEQREIMKFTGDVVPPIRGMAALKKLKAEMNNKSDNNFRVCIKK